MYGLLFFIGTTSTGCCHEWSKARGVRTGAGATYSVQFLILTGFKEGQQHFRCVSRANPWPTGLYAHDCTILPH